MNTMIASVGAVAMSYFIAGSAHSADLYCTGRSWLKIGDGFNTSVLLQLDKKNLGVKLTLPHGNAVGPVSAEPKYYRGMLRLNNEHDVWMSLDRFTGELVASPPAGDDPRKPTYFAGECEEKKPKF